MESYTTWSSQFGDNYADDLFNGTLAEVKAEYERIKGWEQYQGLEARACKIHVEDGQSAYTEKEIILSDDDDKPARQAVVNLNGKQLDYEAAVQVMDDDLREELHGELAPCTEQEFFTAYELAHARRFGEEWELSKANPAW